MEIRQVHLEQLQTVVVLVDTPEQLLPKLVVLVEEELQVLLDSEGLHQINLLPFYLMEL
jgi:hypothetical protein